MRSFKPKYQHIDGRCRLVSFLLLSSPATYLILSTQDDIRHDDDYDSELDIEEVFEVEREENEVKKNSKIVSFHGVHYTLECR